MMECMGNDVVRHSTTSDVLFNTSQRFSTVCTENKMGRHKNDHQVCSWQRCWNQIDLCTCRLKTLCTETWSGLFLKPSWSKSNCKHAEISMQKYQELSTKKSATHIFRRFKIRNDGVWTVPPSHWSTIPGELWLAPTAPHPTSKRGIGEG